MASFLPLLIFLLSLVICSWASPLPPLIIIETSALVNRVRCHENEVFAEMGCEERCHGDRYCSIEPFCLCPEGLKRENSDNGRCVATCPHRSLVKRIIELQVVVLKPVTSIPRKLVASIPKAVGAVKKSTGAVLQLLGSNLREIVSKLKNVEESSTNMLRTLLWLSKTVQF